MPVAHVLGRADRGHLDRHQRVDPGGDRGPHGMVEVTHGGKRLGMHVVGDEQHVARVDAVLQHDGGEFLHVVPRRALAQLHPHPGPQLGERVAAQHRLVVAVHAGGRVGMQAVVVPAVQAPVPGHRQARVAHGADHLVCAGIRLDDAGHVHHLPQPGDALPLKRLADVVGRDRRPGVLEAGQRRHAGRDREQDLELQPAALLEHPADAVEPEDVGDLVIVDEHGRGAVRQDRLGEARHGHHRRLHVHVGVDEPWHEERPVGIEYARLRPARVGGVAEHRDPPRLDRDVDAVEHLARVDADQAPAGDEQVGGLAAHADVRERAREARERRAAVDHSRELCILQYRQRRRPCLPPPTSSTVQQLRQARP